VDFASEGFDAAIQFGNAAAPGTHHLRLKSESVLPVFAPELLVDHSLSNPEDVLKLSLLHIATRPEAWSHWFASQGCQVKQVTGTVHDQFSTIMQAALHGLGVGLLPDYLIEADLAAGRLVPLWGGPVEMPGAYHLVWPERKDRDVAVVTFREWLAGQAETEDDPLPR
jgi:DNA-binding transcriptional LysR family regulator